MFDCVIACSIWQSFGFCGYYVQAKQYRCSLHRLFWLESQPHKGTVIHDTESLGCRKPSLRLVFHQRRSRSRNHNRRTLRPSENSVPILPIPLTTPSFTIIYDHLRWVVGGASRSGRTKPIATRGNVSCDWFILPLLLPTPTIWFSLDHKRDVSDGVVSGVGRKWKRPDSFDSYSVALMTPLRTKIIDFH